MKIEFVKNPTGAFGLSYGPGDVVEMKDDFARELIELGYAIQANKPFVFPDDLPEHPETAESKATPEKAIKSIKPKAKS